MFVYWCYTNFILNISLFVYMYVTTPCTSSDNTWTMNITPIELKTNEDNYQIIQTYLSQSKINGSLKQISQWNPIIELHKYCSSNKNTKLPIFIQISRHSCVNSLPLPLIKVSILPVVSLPAEDSQLCDCDLSNMEYLLGKLFQNTDFFNKPSAIIFVAASQVSSACVWIPTNIIMQNQSSTHRLLQTNPARLTYFVSQIRKKQTKTYVLIAARSILSDNQDFSAEMIKIFQTASNETWIFVTSGVASESSNAQYIQSHITLFKEAILYRHIALFHVFSQSMEVSNAKLLSTLVNQISSSMLSNKSLICQKNIKTTNKVSQQLNKINRVSFMYQTTNSMNSKLVWADKESQSPFSSNQIHYPEDFLNFENVTLTVAFYENKPFIYTTIDNNNSKIFSGLCVDLLSEFSRQLNIKFTYLQVNDSWNQVIEAVHQGKADIGSCDVTVTWQRALKVDFSHSWTSEWKGVVIPIPTDENLFKVFLPIDSHLFVGIIISTIVGGSCIALLSWLSPFSNWNLHIYGQINEVSLKQNCWFLFGTLLQQGQHYFPFACSSRSVVFAYWILAVVLISSYTAALVANLTIPDTPSIPIDLQELVNTNYKFLAAQGGSTESMFMDTTAGTVFQHIIQHNLITFIQQSPYSVMKQQVGYIGDKKKLEYDVKNNCSQYVVIQDAFMAAFLAFPVRKNASFLGAFNYVLQNAIETGLTKRLIDHYWRTKQICTNKGPITIHLKWTFGAFFALFVATFVAMILLIAERTLYKHAPRCFIDNRKIKLDFSKKKQHQPFPEEFKSPKLPELQQRITKKITKSKTI